MSWLYSKVRKDTKHLTNKDVLLSSWQLHKVRLSGSMCVIQVQQHLAVTLFIFKHLSHPPTRMHEHTKALSHDVNPQYSN